MPLAPLSANNLLHPDPTSKGGARFVVERPLSAGGFAITYLAWDQQFDDRCVIKELAIDQLMVRSGATMMPLPGREADVAIWVQKVQKEAQVLHRLRSSGVVPVRATWRENGTAYFAMDFVDGIELPNEPTRGASWATWEPVATKFLAALGAIHAAGLVHGDIKPQNVLVNREGSPVIIDFGTARSTDDAKKTKLTTVAMTPGYCPPELAVRDRAREMGPWSDLYSWALTIMGLVIRHRGIDGAPLDTSARVALQQHGHKDAGIGDETARALRAAGVPEGWVDALMACVALEPSARPQSAEAVRARIDAGSVKAKRAAALEQSAPPELHYDDEDSSRTLNRRLPFIVENSPYIFGLLAVAAVVLGFSSTFFDIFRGAIVETESYSEEADVHTSLAAQWAPEDFEPEGPEAPTAKPAMAPPEEPRTRIQLALQNYVERHQEIEANAAEIDDLTNELFCAVDVECGNVLCTDLIDATLRDASAAKAEAESILQSQANASQARRAVAARATQERCLRATKLALKRRAETCGPD
jgi:serine/threonine protein kinase